MGSKGVIPLPVLCELWTGAPADPPMCVWSESTVPDPGTPSIRAASDPCPHPKLCDEDDSPHLLLLSLSSRCWCCEASSVKLIISFSSSELSDVGSSVVSSSSILYGPHFCFPALGRGSCWLGVCRSWGSNKRIGCGDGCLRALHGEAGGDSLLLFSGLLSACSSSPSINSFAAVFLSCKSSAV